jgi:hypothetical protein
LTRIGGEPRTLIAHKNLEDWEELKEFFRSSNSRTVLQKYVYRKENTGFSSQPTM